jgi:hypothetical protein
MKPFQKAYIPQTEIDLLRAALQGKSLTFFEMYLGPNPSPERITTYIESVIKDSLQDEVWKNDVYQVAKRIVDVPAFQTQVVQLSIKRIDRKPCRDWRDFQAIKNQLVGPECEGCELFPAESRVIDSANQYFIWVLTDPAIRFPFGIDEGKSIRSEEALGKSKNQPFSKT